MRGGKTGGIRDLGGGDKVGAPFRGMKHGLTCGTRRSSDAGEVAAKEFHVQRRPVSSVLKLSQSSSGFGREGAVVFVEGKSTVFMSQVRDPIEVRIELLPPLRLYGAKNVSEEAESQDELWNGEFPVKAGIFGSQYDGDVTTCEGLFSWISWVAIRIEARLTSFPARMSFLILLGTKWECATSG